MSSTPNLNLKRVPETPEERAITNFDTQTMLNENWDKIDTEIKNLNDASGSVSELEQQITVLETQAGNVENLNTTDKTNLVAAINELKTNIGNLTGLNTEIKTNLVASINEVLQKVTAHKDDDVLHNITVQTIKSSKDENGIFTTVEHRRKSDNTLARKSVLSGGTSPEYTTRTITYYKADGLTVIKTDTFSLSYDSDGILISEV